MAAVLRLVQRSNRETIETLEWLLSQARQNKCGDLCLWFSDHQGNESAALTGIYKASPPEALMAAMRLANHITSTYLR